MIVTLNNGLTLSLPDATPLPFDRERGYFVLSGEPFADPDLKVTPAFYAICNDRTEAYELHQYEIVLGRTEDVV